MADAVITLGAGVDGRVRRIEYGYDVWGNLTQITSYDAATGGTILNQIQRAFNGLGQLTSEWQEHGGAVSGSSPRVQYAYSEMAGGCWFLGVPAELTFRCWRNASATNHFPLSHRERGQG